MSISPLTKLLVVVHRDERTPLLAFIQERGVMQITELTQGTVLAAFPELAREDSGRLNDLVALTSQIDFAITFLLPYAKKKSILAALSPEVLRSAADLRSLAEEADVRNLVDEALTLSRELSETGNKITKLESTRDALGPWLSLDLPIEDLRDNSFVRQMLFMIFKVPLDTVTSRLDGVGDTHVLTPLATGPDYSYYHFLCWAGDSAAYEEALAGLGAEKETPPDRTGTYREVYRALRREIADLEGKYRALEHKARTLATQTDRFRALYDHYTIQKEREEVAERLRSSAGVAYVEGWVPVARVDRLRREIDERFSLAETVVFAPAEDEKPPILLENRRLVRPFEIITSLYGMPDPEEFDPTPLYMLFYAVFFGLCLTDAGYGVVLSIILFFVVLRFKYSLGRNKIVQVLLIGSVSTIVLGALTGGWFGDLLGRLPEGSGVQTIGRSIMLFDPLKDTITFMLLCLALGFIQINLGMIVGLVKFIKKRERREAFVKLCWIVFINTAAVLVADYMSTDGVPRWATTIATVSILTVSVGIVACSEPNGNIITRLGWGLYNLYGCTGFVGDLLSYLRLLALGLSTGIIATVVNLVATLLCGVPYVGVVLAVLVFIGGHAFNIAINCLGAFVHTTRLQYVEFFNKFYEGSGKPFRPFGLNPKYVYLKEALYQ